MDTKFEQIDIHKETIGRALNQQRLSVDTFQREYKWEEDHVNELFQDFSEVIISGVPGAEHFLGSIVVTKDQQERPKIVDGQQRLATCLIFLAAMRDYLYTHNDRERAVRWEDRYLMTIDEDTLEPEPHLEINGTDNEYFRAKILSRPDSTDRKMEFDDKPSFRRLDRAAEIARTWVEREAASLRPGQAHLRLKVWKDFIEQRARVIWVEVPDDSTAFRIFETMNDRGLGLSASDLLKNLLFSLTSARRKAEAQQKWFVMQGTIENADDDKHALVTYVRQYWLSAHAHTTRDELYSNIKKQTNSESKAILLLESLTTNASNYAALLNPSDEFWNRYPESLKHQVETLHYIRVTQGRPLLLAAIQRFKDSPAHLERILTAVLNWSVRLLISGRLGSGSLEEKYGEVARLVNDKKLKTVAEITEKFKAYVPTDAQFEAAFSTADVSKAYLARYYLKTLEEHVQKKKGGDEAQWDVSRRGGVNLEHILPKSLKEQHKPLGEWVFRLGNLVLMQVSRNSQLGAADYLPKKSEALLNSDFVLTQEAGGESKWGPDEISARQARLAKLAVAVWPIRVGGK